MEFDCMSPTRTDPYLAGNFLVSIDNVTASAFSEVLGLEAAIEVVDYRAGNSPEQLAQKLPGLNRTPNITLKRGITKDLSLWTWFSGGLTGNVLRTSMTITLKDQAENPVYIWKLTNAWPCRYSGPALIANSSDVAIETLEICYEGLEVMLPA
jgi:phage tail-like protein